MPIDYTDFENKPGKKKPKKGVTIRVADEFWWNEPQADDRASRLVGAGRSIKGHQLDRSQANYRHAAMYGNFDSLGFTSSRDYARSASSPKNKISLNLIASCIDALTAKIAKNKPRPSFLTSGGNYLQQQKAKNLDKFIRGVFYEMNIYLHAVMMFVDALVFGTGVLKLFVNADGRIRSERILPDEIFVDEADGLYGTPRQLLQRKMVAREVLLTEFGDDANTRDVIEKAKSPDDVDTLSGFGDLVEVWEGWHLPSGPGAKDGKHVIAIDGCELFSEDWTKDYFPFVFMHYKRKLLGFWGCGVAELLSGIQLELNRLLRSVSEQLRRKGRGRIFVPIGSKVVAAHMTNNIADVVFFNGQPPVVDNANHVAPEEFMQIDRLYGKGYQEVGLSELTAGSKKPSGLDAAVAIREFNDIESERFIMLGKNWEQAFLDAARIILDLVPDAAPDYSVTLADKKKMERVKWSDVALDKEAYIMQMFPVSSLPQTPSHRKQAVMELVEGGFIADKAEAMRLLDFPDLESENNLAVAAVDDVDATISAILDTTTPKFNPPDEFQNLPLLIQRATAAYLRAKHHGAEEKRLAMLRRLIDGAAAILKPKPQPQPSMPMTPGIAAGVEAPPMPPPMPIPGADLQAPMGPPMPSAAPPPVV